MLVSRLSLRNFQGVKAADLDFDGHALLLGQNNVGKSTICEALELALSPDRQNRFPVVEEYDFYNARYLDESEEPVPIQIEILLTDPTAAIQKACWNHLERWDPEGRRVLQQGDIDQADAEGYQWCLRLKTLARYNKDEDEFEGGTYYAKDYDPQDEQASQVPKSVRRLFGFLYLRALRTGSRALSLERGTLLDVILRIQSLQTGIWEHIRRRLESLDPPIDDGASTLTPVMQSIEKRLAEYIPIAKPGEATHLFVSQLTREHLRKTLSFFVSVSADQKPVPFDRVGTGTLNTLVLALLSFIAELKDENVIFAMEEPEIALPPHTQRRIADYLLKSTTQCFVTSHSPYVIECFDPERITILRRNEAGEVSGKQVALGVAVKAKTYRRFLRRGLAEAMLSKGVIVSEGMTEQLALRAVADKLEQVDETTYPLDLAGVTLFCADGDGSIAEFGRFLCSLDVPVSAFLDKKTRSASERTALEGAGFTHLVETAYAGMEELLVAEVPVNCQWRYLDAVRQSGTRGTVNIPDTQPANDNDTKGLAKQVLVDGKGWGRAADLIDCCSVDELPASLVSFLRTIYEQFPRPKVEEPPATCDAENVGDATTGESAQE